MEARYYLTCLWPGLPELWWRGQLSALPTAIAFALALNLMLVARYLYPEWMSSGLVALAFWVGIATWLFLVVRRVRELPQLLAPRQVSDQPDQFDVAQVAYLRGDWGEAETRLNQVLAIEQRDPPALLLLTGVYRHTGRLEQAEMLLAEIRRLEVADPWWLEVDLEARRLDRALERERESAAEAAPDETDAADLTEPPGMAA
ncbi:MAG: tetratricopeptide repeat protein [Pirellulales bacterium]|nr:tetratricopeptide repeat protein [Pirellulales bacterium]